jgi:anti-anti-sigma regulatory factor
MNKPENRMEQVRDDGGVKILKMIGRFTVETTADFNNVCHAVSRDDSTRAILLDLEDAGEMDTTGFACMINFIKENILKGVKVGVINMNEKEKSLMEILKISPMIKLFDNEAEGVRILSEGE